jgi:hypothetical protein
MNYNVTHRFLYKNVLDLKRNEILTNYTNEFDQQNMPTRKKLSFLSQEQEKRIPGFIGYIITRLRVEQFTVLIVP